MERLSLARIEVVWRSMCTTKTYQRFSVECTACISKASFSTRGIGGVKVTWTPSYFRNLAVVRALESDINIVVVQTTAGETVDRPTLEFSWKDNELIETVTAANPNTIVVAIAPGGKTGRFP